MGKSGSQIANRLIHQQEIAKGFSAAAKTYRQHNQLQQLSAVELLKPMKASELTLDIGAGPGTHFDKSNKVIALDLAMGMLKELKANYSDYQAICADASHLPFHENSFDTIYSNLAMQWCPDLQIAVKESHRVLKPQGYCHISLVVNGSLNELTQLGLQKNQFLTQIEITSAFNSCDWQSLSIQLIPITVYFDNLKALLYSLKGIGASTKLANSNTDNIANKDAVPSGLKGRNYWLQMCKLAETLATSKGIPLSYQIAVIQGQK